MGMIAIHLLQNLRNFNDFKLTLAVIVSSESTKFSVHRGKLSEDEIRPSQVSSQLPSLHQTQTPALITICWYLK